MISRIMRHIGILYNPPILSSGILRRSFWAGLLLAAGLPMAAQTTGPVIQGDVYGGGKNGAVFKSNTSNSNTDSANVVSTNAAEAATYVTVKNGEVRTVFGGGQNGRTYGETNVSVQGGTLGAEKWDNTIHGGVFGAGDGSSAYVFGASTVMVQGGTIYNNVYGGGNKADLYGGGTVNVQGGTYYGKVFGGARLANINGWSYVKLDGSNATTKIVIPEVYGGNDISGKIQPSTQWADNMPLTPAETSIDKTWNTFVEATPKSAATEGNIYVRNLYGGGNGDYDYQTSSAGGEFVRMTDTPAEGEEAATTVDLTSNGKPDADKVYIQLNGGTYGCVYGGGNSATVSVSTDIRLDNASPVTTVPLTRADELELAALGYTENGDQAVPTFQFERVFGGNNKVAMDIRPNWYLTQAGINNLYSGGNEGNMTHPQGIYLAVKEANVSVENVYGGCRKADVDPSSNKGAGTIPEEKFENNTYTYPAGYAARVLISGGKVRNVYGGNDVAGNVYYGNAVEIRSNIIGDVYGGGNGSYPYTDNSANLDNPLYADYYYDPTAGGKATTSAEALNLHRPNAEKVMVHVSGTQAQPVYVGGSVYCGGNSATLRALASGTTVPTALFKIGSYAYMNNVFLGSNGENMIADDMLQKYAETTPLDYSTLNLTDHATFEKYMEGVEVSIRPEVAFDATANGDEADYVPYSTYVGSFYCGGNVGSMSAAGTFDINFLNSVVIFDKLVGGCNSANVPAGTYNAYHEGGMIAKETTKVNLNIAGLKLEPHNLIYDATTNTFSFPWKTEKGWRINKETGALIEEVDILKGGNIYGGCYQSGYINGGVAINITSDAISENITSSTGYLATNSGYKLEDNTDYVFSTALTVFGAGYGENTDIWGDTRITVKDGGRILKVFGGGEEGVVGRVKGTTAEEQWFSAPMTGSTEVNVQPGTTAYVGKAYGGGFEGLVTGNTVVNLDGGTVGNAYAGACNADINGYARMNVGTNGMSGVTVENDVYGGNDFGGSILGSQTNSGYPNGTTATTVGSYTYTKLVKGVVKGNVFGGGSGFYNYEIDPFLTKTQETGFHYPSILDTDPTSGDINTNSYVDISADAEGTQPMATAIVGGGKGFLNLKGIVDMHCTYVLLRGATAREASIATKIFGGGYYSGVKYPRVDAWSGKVGTIYGGTFGATADANSGAALYLDPVKHVNYNCDSTTVNVYSLIDNLTMDVYGAGSYVGSDRTGVYLYGGNVRNVYGGSHFEGVVNNTYVHVPKNSTANVNGLYGGSKGVSLELPCDVQTSHVDFLSSTAYVRDAIYGGNHDYRATQTTNVNVEAPLKSAAFNGKYMPVVGGGLGANTVAGFTHVNLKDSSVVSNAYGGAREGLVLNQYNILGSGVTAYYADGTGNTYAHWQTDADDTKHTQVEISAKALVPGNVYGAGYGANALVSGNSLVNLNGGTVQGDIYGGGYSGNMYRMTSTVTGYDNKDQHNISTTVNINGGTVRQVYGGGYAGTVGSALLSDSANTYVNIGILEGTSYKDGIPAIQRSTYGGGERGSVYGNSHVHLYNGYVGYSYTGDADAAFNEKNYVELLKLNSEDTKNLLSQNGNVFGGGYGEGAVSENTHVRLVKGTVRNSVYGGGEISAVGWGTVSSDKTTATITRPGKTLVEMYGGLVNGNVFGGGRGFSYDLSGNMQSGTEYYTDGYVFGSTDVNIYRGTVGAEALTSSDNNDNGNVFGGGNIGYVYGNSTKKSDGYYYTSTGSLSEDCRVSVKVGGIAEDDITIDGTSYKKGDFVPNESLNKLTNTDATWKKINQDGVIIRNAVFAGGNVSKGSDKIYAFSNTVYGNVTAAVIDVFSRDLVAVGGNGIGGLYGDGNLTFVDGYRELNITNFGTDYYSLPGTLDLSHSADWEQYNNLSERQKEFYTEKYIYDGLGKQGEYVKGDIVKSETYNTFTAEQKTHWSLSQSVINEGRYINTIQRCDFCGIKGSRLVLNGAMDRAQNTSEADFTNYSINRVDELSLNRVTSTGTTHGCYFGIYNVVKFLGSVTSDVSFDAIRTTESSSAADHNYDDDASHAYGTVTYRQWKEANLNANNRNNGSSLNKIALASGVYLELVKELDSNGDKIYGPITGVVELDLLNVTPGEGGGYVYAQNQHGAATYDAAKQYASIISDANEGSVTNKAYTYATPTRADAMQTSGNFVNSLKRIIDDCFPNNDCYYGSNIAPAHYWYLRGEFFVYDQIVSAYTGAASSYSKDISIPLTMTAQSNGKIRLLNVLPGLYTDPEQVKYNPTTGNSDSISINYEKTVKKFGQNDPISYWDWYMTNKEDRKKFKLNTYACREDVTVDGVTYYAGQGVNEETYAGFAGKTVTVTNSNGTTETKDVQSFFNETNSVNKDNGFILTLDLTNPDKWNTYYTLINSASGNKIPSTRWSTMTDTEKKNYVMAPSFQCNTTGVYGQYYFEKDELISKAVYDMQTSVSSLTSGTQAQMEETYIAKDSCNVTIDGSLTIKMAGSTIPASTYNAMSATDKAHFEEAYICVSTVEISSNNYKVLNELVGAEEYNTYTDAIKDKFQPVYYCTQEGSWGGKYYESGKNYNGIDYCQLLANERQYFDFNYDALNLLQTKYNPYFDWTTLNNYATNNGTSRNNYVTGYDKDANEEQLYSATIPVDYTATYAGTTGFTFKNTDGTTVAVTNGTTLTNVQYEQLPNERTHYAYFGMTDASNKTEDGTYVTYIVKKTFDVSGVMYNAGKTMTKGTYESLSDELRTNYVEKVELTKSGDYFYCIEDYTVGENDDHVEGFTSASFDDIDNINYTKGSAVKVGTILDENEMSKIKNYQNDFDVAGSIPVEKASLYVPVTASIDDLSKDRYVTAIYEYSYTECDKSGLHYETRVEKHIVNLRIKFMSGNPVIGKLKEPELVLPLEKVGLDVPAVEEGAFPILSGGWEIYATEQDAKKHRNGREYVNNGERMYWYQDQYYVAYYAETRMGRTFSDPVPVHIANYHRMSDVLMNTSHMSIDHVNCKRDPKIYIDDRTFTYTKADGTSVTGNELDGLQDLYALTNGDFGDKDKNQGRDLKGCANLDFFIQSNVSPTRTWTSLGDDTQCFEGELHGNGHRLENMPQSVFGKLCGRVYNLGVLGTFSGGGVAETGDGYVENCWIYTEGSVPSGTTTKAVYGNPGTDAKVINCYYPNEAVGTNSSNANYASGDAMGKPVQDFLDGHVAFYLNRYYLEARYKLSSTESGGTIANQTFYCQPEGTIEQQESTEEPGTYENKPYEMKYDADYAWYSKWNDATSKLGYIEKYYEDGDFRYADGLKPIKNDMRQTSQGTFIPVYPDDYVIFGQILSYGLYSHRTHGFYPDAIVKHHTELDSKGDVDNSTSGLVNKDGEDNNLIFRAPAYFCNGVYGKSVLFNASAAFRNEFSTGERVWEIQPKLTAIDFTGYGAPKDSKGNVKFSGKEDNYQPLLTYESLNDIKTGGITQNLLVYMPASNGKSVAETSAKIVTDYFKDIDYKESDVVYRTVNVADASSVKGHVVQQTSDGSYVANTDHFLVDKQDFNCPIAYKMNSGKVMGYQRTPDNYVDASTGWEAVCLPFSAELTTTQDKGEITHFYQGSTVGHEYWLREYKGIDSKSTSTTAYANFASPAAGINKKEVTNLYLWDYYYSEDSKLDKNEDSYQTYYSDVRTYNNYPYSQPGTPYILGLPGSRYYEFDLSGNFVPLNRFQDKTIANPGKQTVTFVSEKGTQIAVSDDELETAAVKVGGYTFTPCYTATELSAGSSYPLNAAGGSFDVSATAVNSVPFRPYFVSSSNNTGASRLLLSAASLNEESNTAAAQGLLIYARNGNIVVESHLEENATVTVRSVNGATIARFNLANGEKRETPVYNPGIYLVNNYKLYAK